MPTFIDESGDAGTGDRSPRFFRLAAVWFETYELVDACARAVEQLKVSLGLPAQFEFHFVNLAHPHREAFLSLASRLDFQFVGVSFDKDSADRPRLTKEAVYRAAARAVAVALHENYRTAEGCKPRRPDGGPAALNERVVYDANGDKLYERVLRDEFRLPSDRGGGKLLVKEVKPGGSAATPALQLADMVCGALVRHLSGEGGYCRLIRRRELRVVELPELKASG